MKRIKYLCVVFAATFAATFSFAAGSEPAHAFDHLHPGTVCSPETDDLGGSRVRRSLTFDHLSGSNAGQLRFQCPVHTDSWLPSSSIRTLTLYATEPSGKIGVAQACVVYQPGTGSTCGAYAFWPTGTNNIIVDSAVFRTYPGMPVVIGAMGPGCSIRGYRTSDI